MKTANILSLIEMVPSQGRAPASPSFHVLRPIIEMAYRTAFVVGDARLRHVRITVRHRRPTRSLNASSAS